MSRRTRILISCGAVAALVGLALCATVALRRAEASRAEVQRAMAPLIDGIERFRARNQRPPRSLDELVPAYLPRLPDVPRGGSKWEYHTWGAEAQHFTVTLRLRSETIDFKSDWPGGWFYRDSNF